MKLDNEVADSRLTHHIHIRFDTLQETRMTPTPSPIFFLAMATFGISLAYAVWQLKKVNARIEEDSDGDRQPRA